MDEKLNQIISKINNILFGHSERVEMALLSLLCEGHLLIEDIPGVGKTTLAKALCKLLDLNFKRVQFTNDILPSDIIGGLIFKRETEEFIFNKGPVFTNLLLADEINRAPGRTQSALLEVMQEYKVSVEGREYDVPRPFIVMATQNPENHIGTFPLPESQKDRFFLGLHLGVPERESELKVLQMPSSHERIQELRSILTKEDFNKHKDNIHSISVSDKVLNYILDIMAILRSDYKEYSLSPRAAQALVLASKARAYLNKRDYVIPEDTKIMAPYILGHRLGENLNLKKGQEIVHESISKVPIR
jgi:MoxR-like ATPase